MISLVQYSGSKVGWHCAIQSMYTAKALANGALYLSIYMSVGHTPVCRLDRIANSIELLIS